MAGNDRPISFTYESGLKIADVCHRVLGHGRGEAPIAKRPRHIVGASDGISTDSLTAFALVTETATADCGAPGKCVLLKDDKPGLSPVDAEGEPLVIDESDPDYDADKVHAVEVTFYSLHTDSGCNKNERVRLYSARKIQPDADAPTPGVGEDPLDTIFGQNVDGSGYWQGHGSYSDTRYLGANGPDAEFRDFVTASPDIDGDGSGTCNEAGTGIDFSLDVSVTNGPFIVPPAAYVPPPGP